MGVAEGECEEIKDSDDQANSSQGASPAGKKRKQTAGKATVRKQAKKQCKTSANSKPSSGKCFALMPSFLHADESGDSKCIFGSLSMVNRVYVRYPI